jgi:hypothetical protein
MEIMECISIPCFPCVPCFPSRDPVPCLDARWPPRPPVLTTYGMDHNILNSFARLFLFLSKAYRAARSRASVLDLGGYRYGRRGMISEALEAFRYYEFLGKEAFIQTNSISINSTS